jgi:hypothetical protein
VSLQYEARAAGDERGETDMGAASVGRQIARKRSRKRKARWPQKLKNVRARCQEQIAEVQANAERAVNDALVREGLMVTANVELQSRLDALYLNGPGVVEITHMMQRGFFARLWWALGRAFTGKMRFQRIVEGS